MIFWSFMFIEKSKILFKELGTFVGNHPVACLITFSLALAVYSLAKWGHRDIFWIKKSKGTSQKTENVSSQKMNKPAETQKSENSNPIPLRIRVQLPVSHVKQLSALGILWKDPISDDSLTSEALLPEGWKTKVGPPHRSSCYEAEADFDLIDANNQTRAVISHYWLKEYITPMQVIYVNEMRKSYSSKVSSPTVILSCHKGCAHSSMRQSSPKI